MTITFEAIYEGGVLRPAAPLPLAEHDKVQVTIHAPAAAAEPTSSLGPCDASAGAGLIPCQDAALIELVALDPGLEYGQSDR